MIAFRIDQCQEQHRTGLLLRDDVGRGGAGLVDAPGDGVSNQRPPVLPRQQRRSSVVALIAVAVGWLLNEATLTWRHRTEQRQVVDTSGVGLCRFRSSVDWISDLAFVMAETSRDWRAAHGIQKPRQVLIGEGRLRSVRVIVVGSRTYNPEMLLDALYPPT
jgi:hypothetical protein